MSLFPFPPTLPASLRSIAKKVENNERITPEEGLLLFEKGELCFVGSLANIVRERKHENRTYYNRNSHIEPTNICVFDCKFCSYSRLLKQKDEVCQMSEEDMLNIVRSYIGKPVTEVH